MNHAARRVPSYHDGSALRVVAPIALALTATTAVAQEQEEVTLDDLRKRVEELERQEATTPHFLSSDTGTMSFFGRIHLDAWDIGGGNRDINAFENDDPTQDPQNSVRFRRSRIGFRGNLAEDLEWKSELDFAAPDGLAFKDLFVGFKGLPVLQTLRVGHQKRPYNLDQLNSSNVNIFIERPLAGEAFEQGNRRIGVASYGITEDLAWNWRYGVWNLEGSEQDGDVIGDTLQPEIAGRIANTLWHEDDGRNWAHWALAGTLAFPDGDPTDGDGENQGRFRTKPEAVTEGRWIDTGAIANVDNYFLGSVETALNFGSTQVVAEWQNAWVQRDSGSSDVQFNGGYVYVAHFLTGEHSTWNRKSGTLSRVKMNRRNSQGKRKHAWQVAARYSYADFSQDDIDGGVGKALTLGVNWYFSPHASVQFNYIDGEISNRDVVIGPETFTDGDYRIFGVRLRVDF